jgi:Tol biopolymer transport system component
MFWTRSDGAGKPQLLTQSKVPQTPYSITLDGKRLAFHEIAGTGFHLWTLPLERDGTGLRAGKPELFLQTQFNERSPSFSPDGRWLAYVSKEPGRKEVEVYVQPFPATGGRFQISQSSGFQPLWRADGKELFFLSQDGSIMSTAIDTKGEFQSGIPNQLFANSGLTAAARRQYAVTRDGNRFLLNTPARAADDAPLTVVVNWLAGIQK